MTEKKIFIEKTQKTNLTSENPKEKFTKLRIKKNMLKKKNYVVE
jgi:hypothetical protein